MGLGATVEGIGTTTLRVGAETITSDEPDRRAGRPAARVGAAARAAARAARSRAAGAARRRLSGAAHDRHAPRGARARWARVRLDEPGHALEAPDGLNGASIYLDEASVTGTETALLAAAAAHGRTEIRHAAMRAARRRALRVPAGDGRRRSTAPARRRFASRAPARCAAPSIGCGDYIEAGSWAVVAAVTGGEIEVTRRARRATWKSSPRCCSSMDLDCAMRRRRLRRRAVDADRGAAASRPACGRGSRATSSASSPCSRRRPRPHARPRLAVRAAAVRARAAERHARRSVPLRSAPHHRHAARRKLRGRAARQPRSAIRDGADCRGARGGRARAGVAARNRRARLRALVERLQALGAQVEREDCRSASRRHGIERH